MENNCKKNISIRYLLIFLACFLSLPLRAEEIQIDGITYSYQKGSGEASVSRGDNSLSHVNILPSFICDGYSYKVTSIDVDAFYHCSNLTSIEIPNSVTSIGKNAFSGCSSLTSIEIPNSVTSIGNWAFLDCSSLTSIKIPNSVTSIGYKTFYQCSSLTSIEIPNSVTSIGESAFYHCSSLTSIEIPNSVTSIGNWAFLGCSSLTSIEIPNSVTSIDDSAFFGCSSLTSIEIPNSVTSIGDCAFEYCSSLTSIEIPNSVTSIGYKTFSGCRSLTSIEIPNSVTSIGDGAFEGCSGLLLVAIPDSVTSLGRDVLKDCSRLYSIKIPENLVDINTFDKTNVYYLGGGYEQKSSDFPNLFFRDTAKNHKRLWEGAKIIKTSLTDSLELVNYLSGLTISTPQVLIVPTGCYDYAVEGIARDFEGLSIIEDHNMQFSLTSWEDDLWKLAKDAYAQLNEITQLSSFTSLKTDVQYRIKDMLRDCAALQKDREKDEALSRYDVTYKCLSLYNENLCLMLPLLIHAQELNEWEELLYIDEKLYSDFNMAYQDALNWMNDNDHSLLLKQEYKNLQLSYDAAFAACNEIRNFHDDLRNLLQLAETLKKNE